MKKVFLIILALLLTSCTVGGVDVEQESASGLAGELLDGHSYGQTFTLKYDGLYRLDLYTATYARGNTHPVVFQICTSPACEKDNGLEDTLVTIELPASQISNSGPTVITFPSLSGTAGRTLYFLIKSPGSIPGDAITVYREEQDTYPDGKMYIDGQPTGGDITFIAYTQETFTPTEIWNDFYSRASQDKSFFIFYSTLLVLVLLAIILTLVNSTKFGDSDSIQEDENRSTIENNTEDAQ